MYNLLASSIWRFTGQFSEASCIIIHFIIMSMQFFSFPKSKPRCNLLALSVGITTEFCWAGHFYNTVVEVVRWSRQSRLRGGATALHHCAGGVG